ncbi:hypothetical protein M407DRAFT_7106 [Tulasnella calospora MUT 4182]|uniref:Uncharacterized protein n=1 Tax=Tulasnella calospora MUT 4182 TaxID=1051891 RepID=A0A0C3QKC5_9AGAM|nr:hypothetical protein M407DRAFT_7106 [Tulasnella calospora MUT 4182]
MFMSGVFAVFSELICRGAATSHPRDLSPNNNNHDRPHKQAATTTPGRSSPPSGKDPSGHGRSKAVAPKPVESSQVDGSEVTESAQQELATTESRAFSEVERRIYLKCCRVQDKIENPK